MRIEAGHGWPTTAREERPPRAAVRPPARQSAYALQGRVEACLLELTKSLFEPFRRFPKSGTTESFLRIRATARRLCAGLQFFSDLFPPSELKQVHRQLRRVTRILKDIRALDVQIQLLQRASKRLPSSTAPACASLTQHLLVERAGRSAELRELMQIFEAGKLELRVRATITTRMHHLHAHRLLDSSTDHLNQLRRALRKRYRQYRKKRSPAAFHKLRIAVRRYRYGLEISQAVFQTPAAHRIRAVEELQDRMGDCTEIEGLIRALQETQDRWHERDKNLANRIDPMVKFFRNEEKHKVALFEAFLKEKRGWLKKVKLTWNQDQTRLSP